MSALTVELLLAANRVLPRPALPGRADAASYARWEFDTSEPLLRLWRKAGGRPARRVLDLGCGLGGKTHRLSQEAGPGVQLVALDLALDHLRKAAVYHAQVGLAGLPKVAGDAVRLPFRSGAFDRIVTTDTLEHFPQPRAALAEMRRCVAEDGRLLLLFNPWGSPRGSHLADLLRLPWCQLLFSRATLCEATLQAARRQAARTTDPREAEDVVRFGQELAGHFAQQVHPTRIADFRGWLAQDGLFTLESELHVGPGPLRAAGWLHRRAFEEWLTASYGAVLRPR
jgi:SAM-dependent methyltransferase